MKKLLLLLFLAVLLFASSCHSTKTITGHGKHKTITIKRKIF